MFALIYNNLIRKCWVSDHSSLQIALLWDWDSRGFEFSFCHKRPEDIQQVTEWLSGLIPLWDDDNSTSALSIFIPEELGRVRLMTKMYLEQLGVQPQLQ